ncbi:TPA: hypothetical protein JLM68_004253 [Escherichia coli]|nr:hypothetical protein [Shigella sonnei]HAW1521301.1 hypothetical protein [Escherichia coli]HAW7860510.1 hypothetical protein [Escherichia coli]HAW7865122.1 hypothetical protein [Escherichia coli]
MNTGRGINTVVIGDELKHITDLDEVTLCNEWAKMRREINNLYAVNKSANSGWRGFVLRLLGIKLPEATRKIAEGIEVRR